MKKYTSILSTITVSLLLASCNSEDDSFDASGSFEAVETIISSEAAGTLKQFNLEEGQVVKKGQEIGYVDSTQLHLMKLQLQEQIQSMLGKRPNVSVQLAGLQTQLVTAKNEKKRVDKLVEGNAATSKQSDDVIAQIAVIKSQIAALKSTLTLSSQGITNDANSMELQIDQINDKLKKCQLSIPMDGTVLTTYVRENEMTAPGKPLYKIADLTEMDLRAYISGDQLAKVKLNQTVTVFTDNGDGGFNETNGVITWINSKGEFTPKTIQTKDERANLVYAIKVRVKNDGKFKIGMYGEIKFK
jgi:HlyD family secretion protein